MFRYVIVRFGLNTPGREPEETRAAPRALTAGGAPAGYVAALGGAANLVEVAACTTRLRLELADRALVDRDALKRLGARGTVDVGARGLQVVVGPIADGLAGDIRAYLALPAGAGADAAALLAALGGKRNVAAVDASGGRVLFTLRDAAAVDRASLEAGAPRGVAFVAPTRVHVLHSEPQPLSAAIADLLR